LHADHPEWFRQRESKPVAHLSSDGGKIHVRGRFMRYILAAYNGSDHSLRAVNHAVEMADKTGARLHVLSVATIPAVGSDVYMDDIMRQNLSHCEQLVESLKVKLGASGTTQMMVRIGDPVFEIVRHAVEYGVGQIVVGCRRHWFDRWPASRIVRQIVARAPCKVIVIGNEAATRPRSHEGSIAWESGR
jgi:nucleotide-binding universal stress UspA family protein